jgi:hypothetical protein
MDVTRASLGHVVSPAFTTQFHQLVKTLTHNYPELLKEMFLVNAGAGASTTTSSQQIGSTSIDLMVSMLPGKLPSKTMGKIIVVRQGGGLDDLVDRFHFTRSVLEPWFATPSTTTGTTTKTRQHPLHQSLLVAKQLPPDLPPHAPAATTTATTATTTTATQQNDHLVDALIDSLRSLLQKSEDVERVTLQENQRLRRLLVSGGGDNADDIVSETTPAAKELADLENEVAGLQRSVEFARNFIEMQEDTIVKESRELERAVTAMARENAALQRELETAFGQNAPTYFLDDFKHV